MDTAGIYHDIVVYTRMTWYMDTGSIYHDMVVYTRMTWYMDTAGIYHDMVVYPRIGTWTLLVSTMILLCILG